MTRYDTVRKVKGDQMKGMRHVHMRAQGLPEAREGARRSARSCPCTQAMPAAQHLRAAADQRSCLMPPASNPNKALRAVAQLLP